MVWDVALLILCDSNDPNVQENKVAIGVAAHAIAEAAGLGGLYLEYSYIVVFIIVVLHVSE